VRARNEHADSKIAKQTSAQIIRSAFLRSSAWDALVLAKEVLSIGDRLLSLAFAQPVEKTKMLNCGFLMREGERTGAWVRAKHLFSVGVPEEFVVWNQVSWGLCVQLSGFCCNEF
jgi:hypothetical protein